MVIIASGPLTSGALSESIRKFCGIENLYFYDAISPIVDAETIDYSKAYRASRYGKGDDDYINCPMNQEEYSAFYDALAENASAREAMQSDALRLLARQLAEMVKSMPKLDWTERETVRRALEAAGGVKKDAAEAMGISQRAMSYYVSKHRFEEPEG